VKKSLVRIKKRWHGPGAVKCYLLTILQIRVKLLAHLVWKITTIHKNIALGVVQSRAGSDIVGPDRGNYAIDDHVLGMKSARPLPLVDSNATFE